MVQGDVGITNNWATLTSGAVRDHLFAGHIFYCNSQNHFASARHYDFQICSFFAAAESCVNSKLKMQFPSKIRLIESLKGFLQSKTNYFSKINNEYAWKHPRLVESCSQLRLLSINTKPAPVLDGGTQWLSASVRASQSRGRRFDSRPVPSGTSLRLTGSPLLRKDMRWEWEITRIFPSLNYRVSHDQCEK